MVKFIAWIIAPQPNSSLDPDTEVDQPEQAQTQESPHATEHMMILEEIDALDSLVATLSKQEKELRERAQHTASDSERARLEAQAARVHLQLTRNNNKAIKLWDKLEEENV